MKKIYSIILLLSFLTGAIQPIVPLLEYHFFKESIIEFFCVNRDVPESDCEGFCYLTNQIQESQDKQTETKAGHVEYYPGTILLDHSIDLNVFPEKDSRYIDVTVYDISPSSKTDIPPPKTS